LWEIIKFLKATKTENAEYYFWNCKCGIPDCANMRPVIAKYAKQKDEWFLMLPNPCTPNAFENQDYVYWESHHRKEIVKISREDIKLNLFKIFSEIDEKIKELSNTYRIMSFTGREYLDYEWPMDLPCSLKFYILKE
jgi:hypothetical protein